MSRENFYRDQSSVKSISSTSFITNKADIDANNSSDSIYSVVKIKITVKMVDDYDSLTYPISTNWEKY